MNLYKQLLIQSACALNLNAFVQPFEQIINQLNEIGRDSTGPRLNRV